MSDNPNIDLLRRGYTAFGQGDVATLDAVFDDAAGWHLTGRNPMAGEFVGKPAIFAHFGKLAELTAGTFAVVPHDLLGGDGDRVVALCSVSGTRGERTLENEHIDVFRVAGGRVVEMWSTTLDPYAEDEFWA
jgi:uncharacterized protein